MRIEDFFNSHSIGITFFLHNSFTDKTSMQKIIFDFYPCSVCRCVEIKINNKIKKNKQTWEQMIFYNQTTGMTFFLQNSFTGITSMQKIIFDFYQIFTKVILNLKKNSIWKQMIINNHAIDITFLVHNSFTAKRQCRKSIIFDFCRIFTQVILNVKNIKYWHYKDDFSST